MKLIYLLTALTGFLLIASGGQSQNLFFREDWKEIAATTPVSQEHVANPSLVLSLYGPAKDHVRKSNHPQIPNDPFYLWSGECSGNWAVALHHRDQSVDLTGTGRIVWRSRQSGFRELRMILKLSDGSWVIGDQPDGYTEDWHEKEFKIKDMRWRKLNIETVTEGDWMENPDLSKVREIGFTDLMSGGGTPASSRLDWIEVYGKPVNK